MIYLTADLHLFHRLPALARPFNDYQMDELLISNWNSRIQKGDEVWFLGDFALGHAFPDLKKAFDRLVGCKHLILGNHDHNNKIHRLGWASVHETHLLKPQLPELGEERILIWLSHYAHRTWPQKAHGSLHAYGHSHGHLPPVFNSTDVGVDANNYFPVSVPEFVAKVRAQNLILGPEHNEETNADEESNDT